MSLITFFQALYDENIEALAEFVGADPKNIGRNILFKVIHLIYDIELDILSRSFALLSSSGYSQRGL